MKTDEPTKITKTETEGVKQNETREERKKKQEKTKA